MGKTRCAVGATESVADGGAQGEGERTEGCGGRGRTEGCGECGSTGRGTDGGPKARRSN